MRRSSSGWGFPSGPGSCPSPDMTVPARRIGKWTRIAVGISSLPGRWWNADHAALIRDAARQTSFDLVVVDGLWMDVYRRDLAPPRYVASTHNVESDILLDAARHETGLARFVAERDARLLQRREAAYVAAASATIAVSDDDAARLRALAPSSAVTVVENGTDVLTIKPQLPASQDGPLLFVGSFDYGANVDAARLPDRAGAPDRARAPARTSRSSSRGAIHPRTSGSSRARASRSPAPSPTWRRSTRGRAPSWSRCGSAAARGSRSSRRSRTRRPVVTTAAGMRGLALQPGTHVLVAETPEQFAEAFARLRSDAALGAGLATAGRAWVAERHSWTALEDRFAEVVDRLETAPA